MRRTLAAVAFAIVLTVAVAACGGSSGGGSTDTTPAATTPAATGTEALAAIDGAAIFADNCAGCHGQDGSGGKGPDIRGEDNRDKVVERVTNGGDAMPAFGGQLSTTEIDAVAAHVVESL
jgi:mono/diheme cytochrome c family protein